MRLQGHLGGLATDIDEAGIMISDRQCPLEVSGVHKAFRLRGERIAVLNGAGLRLDAGRVTALVGHSGSGKTSLLQIAGLLATADAGSVRVRGIDATGLDDNRRADLRRVALGFVFQAFNLLPQHNAVRNVALPYAGGAKAGHERALRLLDRVGLAARAGHRPAELSAGEQQRVAIARALINDPGVLLADEPTGNLDAQTEESILALFGEVAAEGRAVLLVTHSSVVARAAGTVVRMHQGTTEVMSS
jgi:putative ABC transport system ATP-binding protein